MTPSQATRCPSCKTVFRVVADQLRVSEGWVRCGRCTNVFNASENMVDMDSGWARSADGSEETARQAPPPPDLRRTARGPAHRARQDGPDTDRLASKIETAMARAQQQPAPPPQQQPFFPPVPAPEAFEFDSGGDLLPPYEPTAPKRPYGSSQAPQPSYGAPPPTAAVDITLPSPTTGLTYRRHTAPGSLGADTAEPAAAPHWREEPDSQQALRQELRHDDADDWQPAPPATRPAAWAASEERSPRLMESLLSDTRRQMPQDRDTRADSDFAPLPGQAPASSTFDETRPESDWAVSALAPGLDELRAEPRPAAAPKPAFMRKVEKERRWRQPQLRALLLGGVATGVLALLLQATLGYKDLLASRFPATRPALDALCAGLGCTVQAAKVIDGLAVESSGLVRVDRTPVYQLQVTLRNRANLELALPALDVTFTDSKGDVIARKVLLPQELGSTIDRQPGSHGGTLAPGRELTLQGSLQSTGGTPDVVAGYTVELFYP